MYFYFFDLHRQKAPVKLTIEHVRQKKRDSVKIVMLTCYDYPTALALDSCGVDVLLVGDSVGTNVLGYKNVSQVTVQDMVHHIGAVARGTSNAFILGDMPFGSFATEELAVANARRLVDAGADGVKIEGETEALRQVAAVVSAGVTVCSHIGYTPQTDARASVQGRDLARAMELIMTAQRLEGAGASMLVLELIPERLAGEISSMVAIPTIGIGAGGLCDGQVQVVLDIAGINNRTFKHAKQYGELGSALRDAVSSYAAEVRGGAFPAEHHSSRLPDEVYNEIHKWCEAQRSGGAPEAVG